MNLDLRSTLRWGAFALLWALCLHPAFSQETRSTIFGRVLDAQGGAVPKATVVVTNTETGTATHLTTNETGYYEANLLIPGTYEVSAEASGFKKSDRRGIGLRVGSRIQVDVNMEVGSLSDTIEVKADATVLDFASASSGRVLSNREIMDLPTFGGSPMLLTRFSAGIQTDGVNNYVNLHGNMGASNYNNGGTAGGNEYTVDGSPNAGQQRRAAYVPNADSIADFKVENFSFDASIGHATGVNVIAMTKSGGNSYHGTATWSHWQQRWNGTPFFTKQLYYNRIAAARAAGNTALADQLASQDKQATGRTNNWAVTLGGPIRIPKIVDTRNKLFFFFGYNGYKEVKTEDATFFNRTVPTMANRDGDFSNLLLVNSSRYQIYDPLTVKADPARTGHYIRLPFAGNVIPKSRIISPVYNAYLKFLPKPNNDPTNPALEPSNNYLAVNTPYNWDYKALQSRADYNLNDKNRVFARFLYNDWHEDRNDWLYETARGLNSNGQKRHNLGGVFDWTWSASPSTIIDVQYSLNEYQEGASQPLANSYKPSDVGLPTYLDARAGDQHILPWMRTNGYADNVYTGYQSWPTGFGTMVHYRTTTQKVTAMHVRGSHSLSAGYDMRQYYRNGGGGGNTSGNFTFQNTYMRQADDTNTAGNLGLTWAAFQLGMPDNSQIAMNDTWAIMTPYYAGYVQDTWRVSPKLTLTLGLRMEYELGLRERFNRAMLNFDPSLSLPISAAAEAAYAANPVVAGLASIKVRGGTLYSNSNASGRVFGNELMWLPRIGAAYQLSSKTAIRLGYGLFYDSNNALNIGIDQTGYSRNTQRDISNDSGMTWLVGNPTAGVSPMSDPFPVRSDGTRFDDPVRAALGLMAKAGRGWDSYNQWNYKHSRQQRWRVGVQHQFSQGWLLDVAYAGSYSDNIPVRQRQDYLPAKYWADGLTRNSALAGDLTTKVANPFNIKYFADLKTSNPIVYSDMAGNSFFSSATIEKQLLLRVLPGYNNVINAASPIGNARSHALEVNVNRRFANNFTMNVAYTEMSTKQATDLLNEFDGDPYWRLSNNGRPRRLAVTSLFEFPFGKGQKWLRGGVPGLLAGGWRLAVTYEYQPGPLLDWGNVFYYGDVNNIKLDTRSWDRWFNTAGCVAPGQTAGPGDTVVPLGTACTQGFEKRNSMVPASYHRRVFPTRIEGLRADSTNQWNANIKRDIQFMERLKMELRLDAFNLQNRSQMSGPTLDPTSTNFGRITSQTSATNRFIQIGARLVF